MDKYARYFGYGQGTYKLSRGGEVTFHWKDLMAVEPNYENTVVTLKNGTKWSLSGRNYGV